MTSTIRKPRATKLPGKEPLAERAKDVLVMLEDQADPRIKAQMGPRYGVWVEKSWGMPVGTMRRIGKKIGLDHDLALALWETGWYEARMVAAFIDDPARVTSAQMDRWCRDFDNWGICDTVCFCLFDRTPHAFRKIEQWASKKPEFVKRAAFALLASVAGHDKEAPDEAFLKCLPLAREAASDERNFVMKGVSWALRGMGHRSHRMHAAVVELAKDLAASPNRPERWIGKDVLKDVNRPLVLKRLSAREKRRAR